MGFVAERVSYKEAINAIKIARLVLIEQKAELQKMVVERDNNEAIAMAALLFLETLESHSVVELDRDYKQ